MFQVDYHSQPGDRVYVVIPNTNSVEEAIVTQVTGIISEIPAGVIVETVNYLVRLNDSAGSTLIPAERVFTTVVDAILFAQSVITSAPSTSGV